MIDDKKLLFPFLIIVAKLKIKGRKNLKVFPFLPWNI